MDKPKTSMFGEPSYNKSAIITRQPLLDENLQKKDCTEPRLHCKVCRKYWKNEEEMHAHKLFDLKHILCFVCRAEFHSLEAKNLHQKLYHAHNQAMTCPRCAGFYKSLGSFTAHLEKECFANFRKHATEITERNRQMQAARNFKGGRNVDDMNGLNVEPMPALRNYAVERDEGGGSTTMRHETALSMKEEKIKLTDKVEMEKDDDLISFDTPLDVGTFQTTGTLSSISAHHSPYLPPHLRSTEIVANTMHEPNSSPLRSEVKEVSKSEEPLLKIIKEKTAVTMIPPVQSAPPASVKVARGNQITDLTKNMAAVKIEEKRAPFDPHRPDPNHPDFVASKYWIAFSNNYRCPHAGCKNTSSNIFQFKAHLGSPKHQKRRVQCHLCLRYFDCMASLAQHSSAQGLRCQIRNSDHYEGEVDRITAGVARTDGLWNDDTIRYTADKKKIVPGLNLAENHRNERREWDDERFRNAHKRLAPW